MSADLTIAHDQLWPREPQFRYRLYNLGPDGSLEVLSAAPELGGVTLALRCRLEEEGPLVGLVGILDTHPYDQPGTWVVNPFRPVVAAPAPHVIDLAQLRADCEYDPEEDGSVDDLIAYKDALEDLLGTIPGVEVRFDG